MRLNLSFVIAICLVVFSIGKDQINNLEPINEVSMAYPTEIVENKHDVDKSSESISDPLVINQLFEHEKLSSHSTSTPNLPSFIDDLNITIDGMELGDYKFGRGQSYVASRSIKMGERILSIPMDNVISAGSIRKARVGIMAEVNPDLPEAIILALQLLEERKMGTESKWHSFMDTIPKLLNSSLFSSPDNYELLKGSQLKRVVDARLGAVKQFYEALSGPVTSTALNPPLFTKEEFSFDNFKWAMGVVWGQTTLMSHNGSSMGMIVPVLNSLSHCSSCVNKLNFSSNNDSIVMYANKDYAKGDEIQINLGKKDYAMFMLNYGICPEPSSSDNLPLRIDLDLNDSLIEFKGQIHKKLNFTMTDPYLLEYGSAELPQHMITSLRIKLLKGAEIELHKTALDGQRLSLRNEYALWRSVFQAVAGMLQQYPTTLQEDKKTISEDDMSEEKRNILRALMLEKSILESAKNQALHHWGNLLVEPAFS